MNAKWTPKYFNITLPNANNIEEYQNVLMKIEGDDSKPELFGLSSTSSASRSIAICRNLLKDLRKIHFNIDDTENYEKRIRPLLVMWKKFKNVSKLHKILVNYINLKKLHQYFLIVHRPLNPFKNKRQVINGRCQSMATL